LLIPQRVLETTDRRLLRCGVNRRAFLQFRSSLMRSVGMPDSEVFEGKPFASLQAIMQAVRPVQIVLS
jgi:hypothetical protein